MARYSTDFVFRLWLVDLVTPLGWVGLGRWTWLRRWVGLGWVGQVDLVTSLGRWASSCLGGNREAKSILEGPEV